MFVTTVFGSPVGGPAGTWGLNGLNWLNFVGYPPAAATPASASDANAPKRDGPAATPAAIDASRPRAWPSCTGRVTARQGFPGYRAWSTSSSSLFAIRNVRPGKGASVPGCLRPVRTPLIFLASSNQRRADIGSTAYTTCPDQQQIVSSGQLQELVVPTILPRSLPVTRRPPQSPISPGLADRP